MTVPVYLSSHRMEITFDVTLLKVSGNAEHSESQVFPRTVCISLRNSW